MENILEVIYLPIDNQFSIPGRSLKSYQSLGLSWCLRGKESTCQYYRHELRSLIHEDPTCLRATKPMHHNYWACVLEWEPQPLKPTRLTARAPQQEKPPQWEVCVLHLDSSPPSPQLEKTWCNNEDPAQPKINKYITFLLKILSTFRIMSNKI